MVEQRLNMPIDQSIGRRITRLQFIKAQKEVFYFDLGLKTEVFLVEFRVDNIRGNTPVLHAFCPTYYNINLESIIVKIDKKDVLTKYSFDATRLIFQYKHTDNRIFSAEYPLDVYYNGEKPSPDLLMTFFIKNIEEQYRNCNFSTN